MSYESFHDFVCGLARPGRTKSADGDRRSWGGGGHYGVGVGLYGVGGGYGNPYGYEYGGNYGYYQPGTPYVVQRPIIENPFFSGLPIEITNPATSGMTLSYMLNDVTYSIPPGYSQNLTLDRSWVISFDRGGNFGPARYGLSGNTIVIGSPNATIGGNNWQG